MQGILKKSKTTTGKDEEMIPVVRDGCKSDRPENEEEKIVLDFKLKVNRK